MGNNTYEDVYKALTDKELTPDKERLIKRMNGTDEDRKVVYDIGRKWGAFTEPFEQWNEKYKPQPPQPIAPQFEVPTFKGGGNEVQTYDGTTLNASLMPKYKPQPPQQPQPTDTAKWWEEPTIADTLTSKNKKPSLDERMQQFSEAAEDTLQQMHTATEQAKEKEQSPAGQWLAKSLDDAWGVADKAMQEEGRRLDEMYSRWQSSTTGALPVASVDWDGLTMQYHDPAKTTQEIINAMPKEHADALLADYEEAIKAELQRQADEYQQANGSTPDPSALAKAETELRNSVLHDVVYNNVIDHGARKLTPKSGAEYAWRKFQNSNLMLQAAGIARANRLRRQGVDVAGGSAMQQLGVEEAGKGRKAVGVASTVLGMMADPTLLLSGGAAGLATKGVASGVAKHALGRQVMSTLGGRMAMGSLGGAVNLGLYEGLGSVVNDLATSNAPTLGSVAENAAKQTAHGAAMGAAIGWLGPASGRVSDRLTRSTASTSGKVAARAGVFTGSTVLEGTIFSTPEWISGERDGWDVWTDNMAMMVGFKGKHMLKSAGNVLGDLKASFDHPTDGRKNRLGFESRLRMRLDAPSDDGMAMTKDEKAELAKYGYDLRELFKENKKAESTTAIVRRSDDASETVSRITDLVNDTRISEAARAKMYYYATGRKLPYSTVMRGELSEDADGKFTVQSMGVNGVITSRHFSSRKSADLELERISRQAELNTVEFGERYKDAVNNEQRIIDACCKVAAARGWDAKDVYRMVKEEMSTPDKEPSAQRQELLQSVLDELGDYTGTEATDALREEIGGKHSVDIDFALRQEAKRRPDEAQAAIDEYIEALYAQKEEPNASEFVDAEDITDQKRLTDRNDPRIQALARVYELLDDNEMALAQFEEYGAEVARRSDLTDEQRQAVLEYEQLRREAEVADALDAEVQRRTNADTGAVHRIEISGEPDGEFYLVYGDVHKTDDGRIESDSSDLLVVFNAKSGKKRVVDVRTIAEVHDPIDAADYREGMTEKPQEEAAPEANDEEQRQETAKEEAPTETETPMPEAPAEDKAAEERPMPQEAAPELKEDAASETPVIEQQPQQEPSTPLSRLPRNDNGEPAFEQAATAGDGWDALVEYSAGDKAVAKTVSDTMAAELQKEVEKLAKQKPKGKTPKEIVESAQKIAADLAKAQRDLEAWQQIAAVEHSRQAEAERAATEKAAMQAATATHTASPKLAEKYRNAPRHEGNEDIITLPDGSQLKGRYILTESGAATPSHDPDNAFAPTEGFPIDKNGQSVNDRDYLRDRDAQRIVQQMADNYDSRALQDPVVVTKEGVVLSGNNRTMSGEIAARQGSDKAYNGYLREFAAKYGFTPEQVEGMEHPRVVFETTEDLPLDATTFSRFNAQEKKTMSKPEQAVKLGKTIPENTFAIIADLVGQYSTMREFYANEKAASNALGLLHQADVVNDNQMAELKTGDALSAAGKELLENSLLGKIFQSSPDAVRMIIEMPTVKEAVIVSLAELAANRKVHGGFDLSDELARAIKLTYDAKKSQPDAYTRGALISPFGRQESLFVDTMGSSQVRDVAVLILADAFNSRKPSDLRNILIEYNKEAQLAANGQMDMFTGAVPTPEEIIQQAIERFNKQSNNERYNFNLPKPDAQQPPADAAVRPTDAAAEDRPAAQRHGDAKATRQDNVSQEDKITHIDPRSMSEREKERRGEMLRNAKAVEVAENTLTATKDTSARKVAEKWWDDNVGELASYSTEVGEVEINKNSIKSSLAHNYGQMKLDAISSLIEGFENAVYLGSMPDFTRQDGVLNHYFAYPINYGGKRCYVFCRALQDANMNRLYVHEVFVSDKIKKGDTLQTAASQPHGGISLYRDILANVLEKSASASSSDIETEPEGKRNGTATPQNGLSKESHQTLASASKDGELQRGVSSAGKVTASSPNKQEKAAKSSPQPSDPYAKGRTLTQSLAEIGEKLESGFREMVVGETYDIVNGIPTKKGLVVGINGTNVEMRFIDENGKAKNTIEEPYMAVQSLLKPTEQSEPQSKTDPQGNPIDSDGKLIIEAVKSISDLTDEDFTAPTRTVALPPLPDAVQKVLSTKGKPIIIKKNIFSRNTDRHGELTPEMSRTILHEALYNPTLYGKNKPLSRPNNWIAINIPDGEGNNKLVVLEVSENKDNVEIVHWHEIDERGLEKIKRQAEREDGQLLILPSEPTEEAGALSGPTSNSPSDRKVTSLPPKKQTLRSKKGETIEDFGEVIAGARKDMLKEMSKAFGDVNAESLIVLPFAKAVKRPAFGNFVETGAMTPDEALFAEALWQTVYSWKKPVTTAKNKTKIQQWATVTAGRIIRLRQFMEADAETRKSMMEQASQALFPYREREMERFTAVKGYNPDKTFDEPCFTPSDEYVIMEIAKRIGLQPGDKTKIPFKIVPSGLTFQSYRVLDDSGKVVSSVSPTRDLNKAIDDMALLVRMVNGDTEVVYPGEYFRIQGCERTVKLTGNYEVSWLTGRGYNIQSKLFKSQEEANAYAAKLKRNGTAARVSEEKTYDGYSSYQIAFKNPISGKSYELPRKFETKEEAAMWLDENTEAASEKANALLAAERGEKKATKEHFQVSFHCLDGKSVYDVILTEQVSSFANFVTIREFATRAEAEAWLKEHKDALEKEYAEYLKRKREFVYFDTSGSRNGEDWRNGKDVTPEAFTDAFGFRGVQFGNWTNDADRQAALNETYDALMDMAKVLNISPRAISLNGELGMAFGARGSGSAMAHYETDRVVINLTKTRGAGSLAHEWWHALDNYLMRREGVARGYVTDLISAKNMATVKPRTDLWDAFAKLMTAVNASEFAKRSKMQKSTYWGSNIEMSARLFAEYVNAKLQAKGNRNHFLSRGIDEKQTENYKHNCYIWHKYKCKMAGETPMTFEEFAQIPESLGDFPYPTPKEVSELSRHMDGIFSVLEQREDEDGKIALFNIGQEREPSPHDAVVYDAAKSLVESTGVKVEEVSGEAAAAMIGNKKASLDTGKANPMGAEVPAISSDDNAKLQKTLDILCKSYENSDSKIKRQHGFRIFRSDISKALGIPERGQSSRYVNIEAKNGQRFTLRISNHNAKASNFDANGETEGISIVISRGVDRGLTNDGRAHVVEYFYSDKKLAKAEGNPYVEIIRGLQQLLYSGEYQDATGMASVHEVYGSDTRYLKDGKGTVYGWTVGGNVYLNRDAMNPETPLHEYTHLWDEMVQHENPGLWRRGVELMKQTPTWDEVMNDPDYADIRDNEDAVASEVHSRLTGEKGAERIDEIINEAKDKDPIERAKAQSLVQRIKRWLSDMFEGLKQTLSKWSGKNLSDLTVDDFINLTLRDLADGLNPNAEMQRGNNARAAMEANPMHDDVHTGVRGREDVKTFDEVLQEAEESKEEYGSLMYPDTTVEMFRKAKEDGVITVYSSKPIEQGTFVSPSRMMAEEYAGGEFVYSMQVPVNSIAWIDHSEGQMGKLESAIDEGLMREPGAEYGATYDVSGAKRQRIEKLRNSAPAAISGTEIEYSPDIKQFKRNALEYGKKLQGSYINEDTGTAIQLQRGRHNGGLNEILQHDLYDKAHIMSIAALPEIIRKGILIESEANNDLEKNPNVSRYQHFVCGLKIGAEDYTVHSIVAIDKNGERYYDHKLSHIEKGKLLDLIENKQSAERILAPTPGTKPTIRSQRKIKELTRLLQVEDKKTDADIRLREVEDEKVLKEFAEGETVVVYRTMQVIDGKLYSPMATKVGGKETPEIKLGVPEQSEEHPEIITKTRVGADGSEHGIVSINKGLNKGTLEVAYNPYIHTSRGVLNDQFSSAYLRPNLVVVRSEIPKSELESGYRDDKAKNAVGEMSWHSGTVSGQLAAVGKPRRVILSRYDRPMEIVPYKEVAQMIAKELEGTDIEIPYNVVQPQIRAELERLGVAISETASGRVGDDADFGKAEYITDMEIERINARQKEMRQTSEEAKSSHAEKLAAKLNSPVRIVSDPTEITHADPKRQEAMRRSKGFYNVETGEVTVVLPNNKDVEDVAATVFHEVVAHKGLREMVGEENYDAFCDEIYSHLKDDLKEQMDTETTRNFMNDPKKGRDHARRVAVDEMFGRLGEKGFDDFTKAERGIWAKLKAKVLDAINKFLGSLKLPKWVKLSDNELRYMLWRSHERMTAKSDYVDQARDAAKRRALGLDKTEIVNRYGETDETSSENIAHGVAVLRELASGKEEVRDAMHRNDLAKYGGETGITFVFGQTGNPTKGYKGGYGIAHIGAKHGAETILKVLDAIANGKITRFNKGNKTIVIEKDGYEALLALTRYGDKETWLFNGWDKIETTDDNGKVSANTVSTQANPTFSREDLGAVVSDAKVTKLFGSSIEEAGEIRLRDTKAETDAAKAAADAAQQAADTERQNRVAAIGGKLSDLHRAMAAQKLYDLKTAKAIQTLANDMLKQGMLHSATDGELKRIMAAIVNATGRKDLTEQCNKLFDIMLQNSLRRAKTDFAKLLRNPGTKLNANGVKVAKGLDADRQRMVQTLRENLSLDSQSLADAIVKAQNDMQSPNAMVAEEAASRLKGMLMAQRYQDEITTRQQNIKDLAQDLKDAEADYKSGVITKAAYDQLADTVEKSIRDERMAMVDAYEQYNNDLVTELMDGYNAYAAYVDAEKARVDEIHHDANSDMEGRDDSTMKPLTKAQKAAQQTANIMQPLLGPLGTFDQMMRMFGRKNAKGEGYLFNRFVRGAVKASGAEWQGRKEAYGKIDAKISEIMGKTATLQTLHDLNATLPKIHIQVAEKGRMVERDITQAEALYIYMVNKMTDGHMKLRRMGVEDADVAKLAADIDPRFIAFADWVQEEFLVDQRLKYNEVYKRMFGASMDAIDHYFPLKIHDNAIAKQYNLAEGVKPNNLSNSVSAIKQRRKNTLPLDLDNCNALNVLANHIDQMEHFAAYGELTRDLNTLLSYKRFEAQVKRMSSAYGGGSQLWSNFVDACEIVTGNYNPEVSVLDKAIVTISKGVTAAKVSARIFTALKQFLSEPAFWAEARVGDIMKNVANPIKAWRWCAENLPSFQQRWESKFAGDPRLMDKATGMLGDKLDRLQAAAAKVGMSPNAFVDALTVCTGAKAVYDSKYRHYRRQGYPHDRAHEMACEDATIAFNSSQQSSDGAFVSRMQKDRTMAAVTFTIFRNSAMAYTRQFYDTARHMKNYLTPGYKAQSLAFMAKQHERNGLPPSMAAAAAKRDYRKSVQRDCVRVMVYGYLLQFLWNAGAYGLYTLFGNDEEKRKAYLKDAAIHGVCGSIEGLTGGDVWSAAGNVFLQSGADPKELGNYNLWKKQLPVVADAERMIGHLGHDWRVGANDCINLLSQAVVGINPQSIEDIVTAAMDFAHGDGDRAREYTMLVAKVLNCPRSQVDEIYFDELNATATEAMTMTPEELIKRYAMEKAMRGAGPMSALYDDITQSYTAQRAAKGATARVKAHMQSEWSDDVNETFQRAKEASQDYNRLKREVGKSKKTYNADEVRAAVEAFRSSTNRNAATIFSGMDKTLSDYTKRYMEATDVDDAKLWYERAIEYKNKCADVLNTADIREQYRKKRELELWVHQIEADRAMKGRKAM